MIHAPAALVVGHPGHELRLFRWLEQMHPRVFVLTDGSGLGRSRIASSHELLAMTGSTAGALMGDFTDHEVYRAIMSGDADALTHATLVIADQLVENGIRSVIADAFEHYNPTHDLCAVMAALAVERAQAESGQAIESYAYAVTKPPSIDGPALDLDEETLQRKMAAAYRFQDLAPEVDALVAHLGMDALRREVLEPLPPGVVIPEPQSTPFYEVRGEQQVAAGRYKTVLRYEQHFLPLVETLVAQVRASQGVRSLTS